MQPYSSVYSRNKWIGLAIPIVLKGTISNLSSNEMLTYYLSWFKITILFPFSFCFKPSFPMSSPLHTFFMPFSFPCYVLFFLSSFLILFHSFFFPPLPFVPSLFSSDFFTSPLPFSFTSCISGWGIRDGHHSSCVFVQYSDSVGWSGSSSWSLASNLSSPQPQEQRCS